MSQTPKGEIRKRATMFSAEIATINCVRYLWADWINSNSSSGMPKFRMTPMVVCGVKIGVHLCHVHLDDSAIRLQLNDDSTVDDQVQKVRSNYDRGIPDLDR